MSGFERLRSAIRRAPASSAGGGVLPEGMIPADRLAKQATRAGTESQPAPVVDEQLAARRDQLIERFVLLQAELGGLYYEMAIRDHVLSDVLAQKAAELQRVDIELAKVERMLRGEDVSSAGECSTCGTPYGATDVFCSQCGSHVHAHSNGSSP